MAQLQINRLTNAAVYINGTALLGVVEECTLPEIKSKMTAHNALGMIGDVELPSGLEKLEATFKWSSFYGSAIGLASNPFQAHSVQVRGNIEQYDASGRVAQTPVIFYLTGSFKNLPLGSFKKHDNWDSTSMMNVTAAKIELDGASILEVDMLANIWKVNGVDIIADFKDNTGA